MAFTLQIRQKKLFGKKVLDIPSLAYACGFCYGSNNDLGEIEKSLGKAEMYCVEEERAFTSRELEQGIEDFAAFSRKSLNQFCGNKEFKSHILTLARWPYTLTEDKVAAWEACTDLSDFERTLHGLQARDVYYAKPRLLQKNDTKETGAFYVLTEECESVFPVRADGDVPL